MFAKTNKLVFDPENLKDADFDKIYSAKMRVLSKRHFTPIQVVKKAAGYLADGSGNTIIDLGSGLGKFCFVSRICYNVKLVGVDFRKNFVNQCNDIVQKYQFNNIEFIHANIMDFDLSKYNRLYFFNSFQEQIDSSSELDLNIDRDPENYYTYTEKLKQKLEQLPTGTKLATYHTFNNQIPFSYKLVDIKCNGNLKLWEKSDVQKSDRFYKELDWLKRNLNSSAF